MNEVSPARSQDNHKFRLYQEITPEKNIYSYTNINPNISTNSNLKTVHDTPPAHPIPPIPTQAHYYVRSQSPILHTLHSEWIDSYNNSPIASPSKDMSTITQTPAAPQTVPVQISRKYETPVKSKVTAYMTPDTNDKIDKVRFDEKLRSHTASPEKEVQTPAKPVPNIDIFFSMLNTIVGKDKMSKVGQYLLRLLIYHANQTKEYLSDETININVIDKRYNDRTKKLNLVRNFLRHPMDFARIVVILFCSRFSKRFAGMVSGISMYRQFLRFGKTPFRVRDIYHKVKSCVEKRDGSSLMTKKFLGELIGFYYGINDETLLLFKCGILTNKSLKKFAGKHEMWAWYYDSLLGIYTALESINKLGQQEMELKVQIQVKNKARNLSKQILGLNGNSNNANVSLYQYLHENSNGADVKALKEIQYSKFKAQLDLYKWMSDFIFDTYSVFHLKLPFDTLQIWFGLIAASLSTYKLYLDTKKAKEA